MSPMESRRIVHVRHSSELLSIGELVVRHVDDLLADVGFAVGSTGVVCGEDAHILCRTVLDEPDETAAEERFCSGEEFFAEGVKGGERVLNVSTDRVTGRSWIVRHATEEKFIVYSHGGMVEESRFCRVAGVFEYETLEAVNELVGCT